MRFHGKPRVGFSALAGLLWLATAGWAAAAPVVYTPVEYPGALSTLLVRINDQNQILGGRVDRSGQPGPFLLENGVFTDLPVFPSAFQTRYFDINNMGQATGFYFDQQFVPHSFLLDNGVFTSFDFPGETRTFAHGINDQGQIVGAYGPGIEGSRGFITDISLQQFTMLDVPGSIETIPYDINNNGDIVGIHSITPDQARGFVLQSGIFTDFIVPGAGGALSPFGYMLLGEAYGLNDAGRIVGAYNDAAGLVHGYIRNPDGSFILPPNPIPGVPITAFNGINNSDVVAAYAANAAFALLGRTGYLVTVVPEPSTLTMFAIGTVGLLGYGWLRRKRRGSTGAANQGVQATAYSLRSYVAPASSRA